MAGGIISSSVTSVLFPVKLERRHLCSGDVIVIRFDPTNLQCDKNCLHVPSANMEGDLPPGDMLPALMSPLKTLFGALIRPGEG